MDEEAMVDFCRAMRVAGEAALWAPVLCILAAGIDMVVVEQQKERKGSRGERQQTGRS